MLRSRESGISERSDSDILLPVFATLVTTDVSTKWFWMNEAPSKHKEYMMFHSLFENCCNAAFSLCCWKHSHFSKFNTHFSFPKKLFLNAGCCNTVDWNCKSLIFSTWCTRDLLVKLKCWQGNSIQILDNNYTNQYNKELFCSDTFWYNICYAPE